MRPGMRMAMARYRSEQMGDSSPSSRMGGYQNEAYRNEGYRNGGYQNGGDMPYESKMMDEGMEARRRRDSRGRYMMDNRWEGHEKEDEPEKKNNVIGFASWEQKKQKKHEPREQEGLDEETAREWVESMIFSDGSKGQKWSLEQAEKMMTLVGAKCDPVEFWAILHAVYSDYSKVFKKYGMDQPEIYASVAKAWLEDEDAVEDKAKAYFEHVVQH